MITFHRPSPWHLIIADSEAGMWASRDATGAWRVLPGRPLAPGPRLGPEQVGPQFVLGLRLCFPAALPEGGLLARLHGDVVAQGRPWRWCLTAMPSAAAVQLRSRLRDTFGSLAAVPDALIDGAGVSTRPGMTL